MKVYIMKRECLWMIRMVALTRLNIEYGTPSDRSWLLLSLVELKALLEPFGIQTFYTDGWGAYARLLDEDQHEVGKWNTQKIERKHLTLRTRIKRLARKTICFSRVRMAA